MMSLLIGLLISILNCADRERVPSNTATFAYPVFGVRVKVVVVSCTGQIAGAREVAHINTPTETGADLVNRRRPRDGRSQNFRSTKCVVATMVTAYSNRVSLYAKRTDIDGQYVLFIIIRCTASYCEMDFKARVQFKYVYYVRIR